MPISIASRKLAAPMVLILLGFGGILTTAPTAHDVHENAASLALNFGTDQLVFLVLLAIGSIWSGLRLWQLLSREVETGNDQSQCRFCGASMLTPSESSRSSRRCRMCGLKQTSHRENP
jgi:hypothetical protein